VNVPVAVVAGEHDLLVGPDVARRVADLVKGANFETNTPSAHLCYLERPNAVTRVLLTLLDSVQFQREQGLWESGPSLAVIGDVSMTPMLSRPGRARP
jgi:hypothetical protein